MSITVEMIHPYDMSALIRESIPGDFVEDTKKYPGHVIVEFQGKSYIQNAHVPQLTKDLF